MGRIWNEIGSVHGKFTTSMYRHMTKNQMMHNHTPRKWRRTKRKSFFLNILRCLIVILFLFFVYFFFKFRFVNQPPSSKSLHVHFDTITFNQSSSRIHLPLASKVNFKSKMIIKTNSSKIKQPCQPIFFWGGGKAGSTTLATLVKHTYNGSVYDKNSQFLDFPKELCIAHHLTKHPNTKRNIHEPYAKFYQSIQYPFNCPKKYVLDACPIYHSQYDANILRILQNPPHENFTPFRFLMLIRDPIDRLISHLNDNFRRRNEQFNITERVLAIRNTTKSVEWRLSLFGESLKNYFHSGLKREHILIIPMIGLSKNAQGVINAIMDFIGGDHKYVQNLHVNKGSKETWSNVAYQKINDTVRHVLKEDFREDVKLLQELVGYPIPWAGQYGLKHEKGKIFQDRHGNFKEINLERIDENWLAVHPIGLIENITKIH